MFIHFYSKKQNHLDQYSYIQHSNFLTSAAGIVHHKRSYIALPIHTSLFQQRYTEYQNNQ